MRTATGYGIWTSITTDSRSRDSRAAAEAALLRAEDKEGAAGVRVQVVAAVTLLPAISHSERVSLRPLNGNTGA